MSAASLRLSFVLLCGRSGSLAGRGASVQWARFRDSVAMGAAVDESVPVQKCARLGRNLAHIEGGTRPHHGLARLSLVVGLSLMASGCLDSPPTYTQSEQIAPFIIDAQVTPYLTVIVPLEPGKAQQFVVPFKSNDVGEDLEGNVYLDSEPGQPGSWRSRQVVPASAGGYEDERPPVVINFTARPGIDEPGCHTLTLILAHESQWDFVELPQVDNPVRLPIDDTRAASVIWWLDIAGPEPRRICPALGETAP